MRKYPRTAAPPQPSSEASTLSRISRTRPTPNVSWTVSSSSRNRSPPYLSFYSSSCSLPVSPLGLRTRLCFPHHRPLLSTLVSVSLVRYVSFSSSEHRRYCQHPSCSFLLTPILASRYVSCTFILSHSSLYTRGPASSRRLQSCSLVSRPSLSNLATTTSTSHFQCRLATPSAFPSRSLQSVRPHHLLLGTCRYTSNPLYALLA